MSIEINRSKIKITLYQHLQAVKASFHQLGISPFSSIMTFIVVGIALAFPMGLYVVLKNVQTVTSGLHTTTKITLYLEKGIDRTYVDNLIRILKGDSDVTDVKYISSADGLKIFQKQFGDVVGDLEENPLPSVIIVEPSRKIENSFQASQLVERLKRLTFVKEVQLDMNWLERLNSILELWQRIINVLILFFAFTVLLIIGNTIRLITQNHQDEILIIKLLGGKNDFIRRPFLYSGMIYGLMGSIIAWLLVDSIVLCLKGPIERLMNLYGDSFYFNGLGFKSTLLLLIFGALLGYLGSLFTVSQQIGTIEPE